MPSRQETSERRAQLTERLHKALDTCAPLLREIMSDFRPFLQKTLLGTHSQEIMNDAKGTCNSFCMKFSVCA